jgi:hypothetical protein
MSEDLVQARLLLVTILSLGTSTAGAQIIDSRGAGLGGGEPIAFTSLSVGWFNHSSLCDPDSNSCWEFGGAPQFRVSFEAPMGRGASIGIAGSTARVPMLYSGGVLSSCSRCDADANVSQVMGLIHIGGSGRGFQQVIDLSAGMTLFSSFRTTDGVRLEPSKTTSSFNFAVGYGFGYGITDRLQLILVQDYGLLIHKRMPGESSNTAQQSATRIGARYGLGSKRRGF